MGVRQTHTVTDGNQDAEDSTLDYRDIDQRLVELTDRAQRAGLHTSWARWKWKSAGPPWLTVDLPSGRKVYSLDVHAEHADLLAEYEFEKWTVIDGYRAVLDKARHEIVAEVQHYDDRWMSKVPGVAESPPAESPAEDEYASSAPTWAIKLQDSRSGMAIDLTTGRGWQLRALDPAMGGRMTLRITGVECERHDEAQSLLVRLATALFFEIDLAYGASLRLHAAFDTSDLPAGPPAEPQPAAMSFPAREYPVGPLNLYLHASTYHRGFSPMPLEQFLAYYQVIEHFLPVYSRREALHRFRISLKDPHLNVDDDVTIGRLVALAAEGGRNLSEREQLRLTIAACCNDADLTSFLAADSARATFFADKSMISGVRTIHLNDQRAPVCEQVADRLYDLRCRIVHTKDGLAGGAAGPLLPFESEAKRLSQDIALARHLAQRILIAASKTRI